MKFIPVDGFGVKFGEKSGEVSILFNEVDVLIGDLELFFIDIGREFRR